MNKIGFSLFATVLVAVSPAAFGQLFTADLPKKSGTVSVVQTLYAQESDTIGTTTSEFDSAQRNHITFAGPVSTGEKSEASFSLPLVTPTLTPVARSVAQEVVTKSHRLRLSPQVFERNIVEKLESRFVPIRSVEGTSGLVRFRLPTQDGTDIELVINQQHGAVSITGSAKMVDSCLQIVRFLDTEDNTRAVTRFVPVQQSNVTPARRIAGILNQETQKLDQAGRPSLDGTQRSELRENITAGSVVGPVNIDIIDGWDTMVIQGSPRDVEVIRGILKQLETLSVEHEPIIELVVIKHADSLRVHQLVQQLYAQTYLARRGTVTMLPLVKPNTILLIGKPESINAAKELIAKLDTPVDPHAAFQIFPLKHAASDTLATQITQSFQNRPGYGSGLAPQVNAVSDSRTNTLIVQASPRDIAEVAAMIRQLDIPGSEITSFVRSFPLKNAIASELAVVLQNAFQNNTNQQRQAMLSLGKVDEEGNLMRSSVLYNVTIVAETRSNTLIVTAPPETMLLVEALIGQLDQLPSAESRIKVFTLVNGDAYTLAQLLMNLFTTGTGTGMGTGIGTQTSPIATVRPGIEEGESTLVNVRFQADIRTNSIVAMGSEGDLAMAEALLLRLDAENMNNRRVFTMRLINIPAADIAPILQQHISTERQIDIQNSTTLLPQSPLEQYQKEINIIAEPISNSLIISTTPRYYEQIRKIIQELDERPLMVAIQVLIAEVQLNRSKDRGMEIGLQDSLLFDRSVNTSPLNLPGFPGLLFGNPAPGDSRTGALASQGVTSLGVGRTGANGIGGFTFSASSESVSVLIRALEVRDRIQVLSNPKLVTLHNKRAQIQVGQDVPYVTGVNMNYSATQSATDFKQVGTILDITPRIMPDGMIAMAVYVERSSTGTEAEAVPLYVVDGQVIKQSRFNITNAQTTINAMDGQTVIFSGLITEEKISTNRSIPGLNKIPVIKHLFESDSQICNRSELLIVLTPTIIRTPEDMVMLEQEEKERIHWCINDVVKLMGPSYSGMRLRSDEWSPCEVPHTYGTPVILNESQLPPDNKIPMPMFPMIETK